ncbi:MAG: GNAT family N-acetyltransferase [Sulfuriferula sp.]
MDIRIAVTDRGIAACFAVMRELRPHLIEDEFITRVRGQEKAGYRLAFVQHSADLVTVAGFREGDSLSWGHFLYVDDLVTLATHRSKGYGAKLLAWLEEYALAAGCLQFHLDSGIQRKAAHRFYEGTGMTVTGLHFVKMLAGRPQA